jgi:hypothetical protein
MTIPAVSYGRDREREERRMGDPAITQYYTARVTLTLTLAKDEAEALALFLAGARPRQRALAQALRQIRGALADRGIQGPEKKKPPEGGSR